MTPFVMKTLKFYLSKL